MNRQEAESYAEDLGYTLHFHTGDNKTFSFVKDNIHLEIDLELNQMKLIYVHTKSLLQTSTGWFQMAHPQFKTLFEAKIKAVALAEKIYL